MPTFEKLIEEIIPYPADYSHRNGFSNYHIIDKLNSPEKLEVEKALIAKLSEHPDDLLIELKVLAQEIFDNYTPLTFPTKWRKLKL